jgi:hypothetical protein
MYVATLHGSFRLYLPSFHSFSNAEAEMPLDIISKDQKLTHKSRFPLEAGKRESTELQVNDVMSATHYLTFHCSLPHTVLPHHI